MAPGTVLVVDDNELGLRTTTQQLLDAGFAVSGAASGEEALRIVSPDHLAIVLDIELPGLDGFQLCRILKAREATRHLPVVHCTASRSADVKTHVKSLELGADAYLPKPVSEEVLVATVRALIKAREAERKLSDARQQLALSERMVTVGTLAAGVAHEINNPLSSVLANVEYALERLERAQDGADAETVQSVLEALTDARDGTDRVRRIVQDLQIFSQSRADAEGPVNVRTLMETTLSLARLELQHRCRTIEHFEEVPDVIANEHRLGQVFLNLLLNAAQAIRPGAPDQNEVEISVGSRDGFVDVQVRDTGVGIEPDRLSRIFDPFYTTRTVGQGMGLGLALAHRLIGDLGGSITAESKVGSGTTLRIRLPVAPTVDVN
ncbi:MAG: ATP-binding protein [Polyangiaceae bacterium]